MISKKQGRRSAQDAKKTRYLILKTAATLFCEFGYARVSLRNISEKAGISHSLIRHHFVSKEKIWYDIIDGLQSYMQHYIHKVLDNIPESTPINIKLYWFSMRLLAHGLVIKEPIQLIADAIRQEGKLFNYFFDESGGIESTIHGLANEYNRTFPNSPIRIAEIKWQIIMYIHSAASLTPFLKEAWAQETADLDLCLLRHWQLLNRSMIQTFEVPKEQELNPNQVADLVYSFNYNWEEYCSELHKAQLPQEKLSLMGVKIKVHS